jgi:2-iminoacetate synthase
MSFVAELKTLPMDGWIERSLTAGPREVRAALDRSQPGLEDLACLISPAALQYLPLMGQRAHHLTQQRFGKVVRLFAPLYLSNECVNNCRYCGFSRDNPILRVTLTKDEVLREARALLNQGFRNLLLVAGEQPKFVSQTYLVDCIQALHQDFPSISLELGPMETDEYRQLVAAGADGLVVYQETYDRAVYDQMHTSGPKRNYDHRLETPERASVAGMRRLGIGALFGLADWRREVLCLAAHARYLLRHCWKSYLTISLPRLRPHAGSFQPLTHMSDREMVQVVCALRLLFPDAGLVLSTRERPALRDGLIPLGITLISAGSHTEPGGYTGAGREHTHLTLRGKIVGGANPATEADTIQTDSVTNATVQFSIADERSPQEIARVLQRLGYEPVWKDWDAALTA